MKDMKPVAGEAKMNRAEEHEPKSGHSRPAAAKGGSEVGGETKANMRGALEGNPTDGMKGHLGHAMDELHSQHPIEHHDHGPHHGTDHHIRNNTGDMLRSMAKHGYGR